jgi:isopentenyldiphosphate isomerase
MKSYGELVERVDEGDRVVGVVDREAAVREGWMHRIARTVCRDPGGRFLVYRRAGGVRRFPGYFDVMFGGGVGVGESYTAAASRELEEELGVSVPVRFLFKFRCEGVLGRYWLGVHEAVIAGELSADPEEVAWLGWLTLAELERSVDEQVYVPDGLVALRRYLG